MSDWIDGDVGDEAANVAIGKNLRQTIVRRETESWREFVRRDMETHGRFIMGLLGAVLVLFLLGAVLSGLAIRQFDMIYQRLEHIERRIPYVPPEYYYPGTPLP